MLHSVREEFVSFQRTPLWQIQAFPSDRRSGLTMRSVVDAEYLGLPDSLNKCRMNMEKGEDVRVVSMLPVKMLIVDRRFGIIPLHVEDKNGPVLLLRSSSLLDSLYALFELIWERSTPIILTQSGEWAAETAAPQLSEAARRVIPLLSVGLNDKAIADEAGISQTTLNRRIAELMKSYGTRTRFQLGWRAALEAFPERTTVKAP
jgi:DNA-binding CsgD family transcriptional regulator